MGFPGTHLPIHEIYKMRVLSLGQEDPLDEGMAIHSSILAWRILWTEEPQATVLEVAKNWI